MARQTKHTTSDPSTSPETIKAQPPPGGEIHPNGDHPADSGLGADADSSENGGSSFSVPALTISEAAFVCRRNKSTIRRRLEAGAFPHARRVFGDGPWLIPIPDLEAAGLRVGRDFALEAPPPTAERVMELEKEIAILRERLVAAESMSAEREARIGDFRTALRLLEESDRTDPLQMQTVDRLTDLERKLRILIYYLREGQEQQRAQALPRGPRRWWPWRRG